MRGQSMPFQCKRICGAAKICETETGRDGEDCHNMIISELARSKPLLVAEPAFLIKTPRSRIAMNTRRPEGLAGDDGDPGQLGHHARPMWCREQPLPAEEAVSGDAVITVTAPGGVEDWSARACVSAVD